MSRNERLEGAEEVEVRSWGCGGGRQGCLDGERQGGIGNEKGAELQRGGLRRMKADGGLEACGGQGRLRLKR